MDENEKYIEKCDGVDKETGLRDCWNLICQKNHTWRYYELNPKDKTLITETP